MNALHLTVEEVSLLARIVDRLRGQDARSFAPIEDELIDTYQVARMLHISVFTVRKRAARRGDPLRRARSRLGKQRPMHFHLSKIREIERDRATV